MQVEEQVKFSKSAQARHCAEVVETKANDAVQQANLRLEEQMGRLKSAHQERENEYRRRDTILEAGRKYAEAEELRAKAASLEQLGDELMSTVGLIPTGEVTLPTLASILDLDDTENTDKKNGHNAPNGNGKAVTPLATVDF